MMLFAAGLSILIGLHVFTTLMRRARERAIVAIGEPVYKGVYSLAALGGLALIVIGWPAASVEPLYAPPAWTRHVAALLMPVAFWLAAAAYLPAGRVAAAVKHPMLAGVKIWAFAHLLANGEIRSVALFGGVLAYAVLARIALKKRAAPTREAGGAVNDVIAAGAGLVAYTLVLVLLHPYIAGVSLVG